MVRVTSAQARLLFGATQQRAPNKAGPRVGRKRADLPENQVAGQIKGYLEARGWNLVRNHVGTFVPYRVLLHLCEAMESGADMMAELEKARRNVVRMGEKGDPDWRAVKPIPGRHQPREFLMFMLEFKRPGARPEPHQMLQIDKLNATGTPAAYFDGFDTGRSPFLPWFRKHYDSEIPLTCAERLAVTAPQPAAAS